MALFAAGVAGVNWRAGVREAAAEAAAPPVGAFVEVDGRPVHYVTMGEGPDLVLIHGAGGNLRDFTMGFAEHLTDRYRVTIFDRPGHGYTPVAEENRGAFQTSAEGPQAQAALLQAAAAQLGITRPLVLGQSFGGAVALAWAVHHPDAIAGLINVSGVANPWPGELNWTYKLNGSALGGGLVAPLFTAFLPRAGAVDIASAVFAPQEMPVQYPDHIGVELSLRRASIRANARQVLTLRPHIVEQAKAYPGLDLPVEIVHGTADEIVPLVIHSEPLSQQIPGAVLTRLDDVGHMPQHVAVEAVIAAIDRAATRAGLR